MSQQDLTSTELAEFAAVARQLSFAKAALELGLHPSVFSRRIQMLERKLAVRLLERDTRRVALTDAGAVLLARALDIHARIAAAATEIAALAREPTGTLHLTVPNLLGQLHIAPLMPAFLGRHPHLKLRMTFSDRYEDLMQSGFDAAVRVGALEAGGNLRVRKLAPNRRVLCAAPSYLARAGTPRHPSELSQHKTLHFSANAARAVWQLKGPKGAIEAAVDPVLIADNGEVLRQAALAGMGIAILPTFLVGGDLAAGRLVTAFPDYVPRESTISVVYRNAPHPPRRVRVLIDFLVEAFRGAPPWESRVSKYVTQRNKTAGKPR
jgi:DNA-binding transcriptional LysR family regulator